MDTYPWPGLGGGGVARGPRPPTQGCIRREGKAASEAVAQAVGEGCQSAWGRLLSVANAVEAGTAVRGTVAGHRLDALEGVWGTLPPPFQRIPAPPPPPHWHHWAVSWPFHGRFGPTTTSTHTQVPATGASATPVPCPTPARGPRGPFPSCLPSAPKETRAELRAEIQQDLDGNHNGNVTRAEAEAFIFRRAAAAAAGSGFREEQAPPKTEVVNVPHHSGTQLKATSQNEFFETEFQKSGPSHWGSRAFNCGGGGVNRAP